MTGAKESNECAWSDDDLKCDRSPVVRNRHSGCYWCPDHLNLDDLMQGGYLP